MEESKNSSDPAEEGGKYCEILDQISRSIFPFPGGGIEERRRDLEEESKKKKERLGGGIEGRRRDLEERSKKGETWRRNRRKKERLGGGNDVYSDEGGLEIVVAVARGDGTDRGEREGGCSREEAGPVSTAPRLSSRRCFEGIYSVLGRSRQR